MSREVCGICWCPYDEDTGECACAPVQPRGAMMNREDIIRMAREADDFADTYTPQYVTLPNEWSVIRDERFAALVAAAERDKYEAKFKQLEALMQVREQQPNKPCCLAEREACAKVCEDTDLVDYEHCMVLHHDGHATLRNAAAAIRARGETK